MSRKKSEPAEAVVTPTLDQAIEGLKKINNDFTESIKALSGTVDGITERYDELEKQYNDLRKEFDRMSSALEDITTRAKDLEKQISEKFGYLEVKPDGVKVYDRIGGKLLAGPFLAPTKKEEKPAEKEPEPVEPESEEPAPLEGESRTDQNGKMYVYVDAGSDNYTVHITSKEPLEVTRKTAAFFVVEGKPDMAFKWEVSD